MLKLATEDQSFFVGSIFGQRGQLSSDIVVVVGILVLVSVVGAVGVGACVEASSWAWWHCTMCRMSQPFLRLPMIYDAMGQGKGFDPSSIALLLSIVCAMWMWQFLSATVANFLLHSGFRQVMLRSRVLSSLGLTLPKLIFDHVDD